MLACLVVVCTHNCTDIKLYPWRRTEAKLYCRWKTESSLHSKGFSIKYKQIDIKKHHSAAKWHSPAVSQCALSPSQVTATGSAQTMEPLTHTHTHWLRLYRKTCQQTEKLSKERQEQPPPNYIMPWNPLPGLVLSSKLGRSLSLPRSKTRTVGFLDPF